VRPVARLFSSTRSALVSIMRPPMHRYDTTKFTVTVH